MVKYAKNINGQVLNSPYPHVVLDDFFHIEQHDRICEYFKKLEAEGKHEEFNPAYLSRFPGYDAYCWVFEPDVPEPLDVFYSKGLRNHFAQMFDVALSEEVVTEFHHHEVGSKSDCWHNDYNLAYFAEKENSEAEMNPWYFQTNYMGNLHNIATSALERYRAMTLIYYFGDRDWKEGDGGETGIGLNVKGEVMSYSKVAPHANRMLAFICSPFSYHRFLKNNRSVRNTVILWYHTEVEKGIKKYGEAPRGWSKGDLLGGKRAEDGTPLNEVIY